MDAVSISCQVIRSRRKTLSLEITPAGQVLVRSPLRMPRKEIRRFLDQKQDWIAAHLARIPKVTPLTPEEHRDLIRLAKDCLPVIVSHYARIMDVTYGRITVRSQRTRWGSCSGTGNLSFNCLLMLAPEPVRDYVVVHELCHRKHMDHSREFWAEVERILPDWKTQRRWLKEEGAGLLAKFPDTC